jgi:hypothetical protein
VRGDRPFATLSVVAPTSTTAAERPLRALVDRYRDEIRTTARCHGGTRVRLSARWPGATRPIERRRLPGRLRTRASLFDLVDLIADLRSLLGVDVDVVSTGGLLDRDDGIRTEAQDL